MGKKGETEEKAAEEKEKYWKKMQRGAGKAATGVVGAAVGASKGVAAGARTVKKNADHGFVLFVLGLITFGFNEYLGNVVLAVLIGTVFMFYSALFIFNRKGLMITILFWVWYVFFGGTTDPQTIIYYILPIILIGMIIHGAFSKVSKRDTFVGGAGGELIGLIPILFFFLDLGLIPLLVETFNLPLTTTVQNIILFVPWWAMLGAFTSEPAEGEKVKNFLVTAAKLIMIIWVFSILTFGIAPEAYGAYKSAIAGPEELLKAKEEVSAKIPQKENPAYSNFICIFTEPTNVQACVNKRQEESEIRSFCEGREDVRQGITDLEECKKEEREKKEKTVLLVAGTDDPSIKEPTRVEFKVSEYFPRTTYQATYPYPIQLEIKNPRQQVLDISLDCFFKKGNEDIAGVIEPRSFTINKKSDAKGVTCTPTKDLNGSYSLVYQANIGNITTLSRLTRLFVGDVSEKTEEEIEELKRTYVPGEKYLSQAPNEFAKINFGFGEPETNPVIEQDDRPLLISTIENAGGGKILAVKDYRIQLENEGIFGNNPECFIGTSEKIKEINLLLSQLKTTFRGITPLTSCFIDLPYELQNPEEFIIKEFEAALEYDYQIQKEIKIDVKTIES